MTISPAARLEGIEISLIRQINALATPDSVNLGIGEPNIAPDEALHEKARRAADAGWAYSPNPGFLSLREAIAAERAPDRNPTDEICVTAGTQEGLYAIFQAFVGPGDEVLVPDPGFVAYATLARLAGATVRTYRLEPPEWSLDAPEVVSRISERTKLVIINTPSNPLGALAGRDALEQVAAAAGARDAIVVIDQVYRDLWYEQPSPDTGGLGDNVIVIDGMSKSHAMTGLRLGWVLAAAALMKPVVTAHQYIATCASVFAQRLAESILRDQASNQRWLAYVRERLSEQRHAILRSLDRNLGITIPPPAGAFYAFVPMPSCDTLELAKRLAKEAEVLVIPGVAFGTNGEGFVRMSYAASPAAIEEGVRRIATWMDENDR